MRDEDRRSHIRDEVRVDNKVTEVDLTGESTEDREISPEVSVKTQEKREEWVTDPEKMNFN